MSANKPTTVLDKSLFQAICSEPDEKQRNFFWKEILQRYEIIIPFILIEEIWINLVKPGTKDSVVISQMVKTIQEMSSCWIDDEVEIVFKELIKKKRHKILPPPAKKVIESLQRLNPTDPALSRMCKRLLTRDEGMANMMRTLKECGFWNGETVHLEPRQSLAAQIPSMLI